MTHEVCYVVTSIEHYNFWVYTFVLSLVCVTPTFFVLGTKVEKNKIYNGSTLQYHEPSFSMFY
jgi:hypothetical protein